MPRVLTGSVLDADMTSVARELRRGWAWWTEQLKGLLPARERRPRLGGGAVAWLDAEGDARLTRGGQDLPLDRARRLATVVALPAAWVLERDVTMPALAEADVRRAIRLDLDRLLPFPPGAALVELEVGAPLADGSRPVAVAALPTLRAQAALDRATHAGIEPAALALLDADEAVRFDFLPALRRARGERDVHAERRFWWRTVLALFLLNLAVLIATDVRSLDRLEGLVAAQARLADHVRVDRRRLIAEQGWRQRLVARRAAREPLGVIADLTARLPADAWLRRLELDGAGGRIVGVAPSGTDVTGALRRDARYRNVRASSVDVIASTPEGQPFDISFDLAE